jgi:hypothetical protein
MFAPVVGTSAGTAATSDGDATGEVPTEATDGEPLATGLVEFGGGDREPQPGQPAGTCDCQY